MDMNPEGTHEGANLKDEMMGNTSTNSAIH
jgi:hypothetical protein